jgi:hypothetical protein
MFDNIGQGLLTNPITGEAAPEGMMYNLDYATGEYLLAKKPERLRTPDDILKEEPVDVAFVPGSNEIDPTGNPMDSTRPNQVIYSNRSLVIEARRRLFKAYGRRKTIVTGPMGLMTPAPVNYRVATTQENANQQIAEFEAMQEGQE